MNTSTSELSALINARYPLIQIVSAEEERAILALESIAKTTKQTLVVWSATKGFRSVHVAPGGQSVSKEKTDPTTALLKIESAEMSAIFVMLDVNPYMKDPIFVRALRDVVQAFRKGNKARTVILVSPAQGVPVEVEKEAAIVHFALPTRDELRAVAAPLAQSIGVTLTEDMIDACTGLTQAEAENALAKSAVETNTIDPRSVLQEKRQIVKKSGLLEYIDTEENMETVGGLACAKDWLRKRRAAFSEKARAYGLPTPKGIIVVGPPGTGKSLLAKAAGNAWGYPLLRLDLGSMFKGLVGGSEETMRNALKVVEAVAPCVLWIDEIEKGFSGTGSSDMTDGGTTSRVFSTFLTWMQEKKAPVFVVATANAVDKLPPELLRKGRFDEVFFVDLPNAHERADIIRIQLVKFGRNPLNFALSNIADACAGYTGAEIEQVIVHALYEAFDQDLEVTNAHVLQAIPKITPIAKQAEDKIKALRDWAESRAQPANRSEGVMENGRFQTIRLGDHGMLLGPKS